MAPHLRGGSRAISASATAVVSKYPSRRSLRRVRHRLTTMPSSHALKRSGVRQISDAKKTRRSRRPARRSLHPPRTTSRRAKSNPAAHRWRRFMPPRQKSASETSIDARSACLLLLGGWVCAADARGVVQDALDRRRFLAIRNLRSRSVSKRGLLRLRRSIYAGRA